MIFFLHILAAIALLPLVVIAAVILLYAPWCVLFTWVIPNLLADFGRFKAAIIRHRRKRTRPWE